MFNITTTTIDDVELKKQLRQDQCGGFCSFEGWVRNHNNDQEVNRLEYSVYEELATIMGRQIIEKAQAMYDIEKAACVHRVGELVIGDMAVWVGVSARHRQAAFGACQFIIDTLKADIPIWKKEYYVDKENHEWVSNRENRP